jgi:hypothetical protein
MAWTADRKGCAAERGAMSLPEMDRIIHVIAIEMNAEHIRAWC